LAQGIIPPEERVSSGGLSLPRIPSNPKSECTAEDQAKVPGASGQKIPLFLIVVVLALASIFPAHLPCRSVLAGDEEDSGFFRQEGYIRMGQKGDAVAVLQKILGSLGYYLGAQDGVFGEKTDRAVREFQVSCGLSPDGIVGPRTRKALETAYYRKNPPETHTVQKGETLWEISEKYGVAVPALTRLNDLKNPDRIYAGQVLKIRGQVQEDPSESGLSPTDVKPPTYPIPSRRICLSFDDGPDPLTTRAMLEVLERYGIRATFFVIGEKVDKYPELLKEVAARGHVIGVHGYEHKILAGLGAKEVQKDLQMAVDTIHRVTGQKPYLYRPPGGALDEVQVQEASKLGLTVMMWTNIGGADLGARTSQEVVQRVVGSARDGGIILLHESLEETLKALPQIIESLARAGFGFQNPSSGK